MALSAAGTSQECSLFTNSLNPANTL